MIDFGKTSFFNADFLNTLLRCHLSAKSGNRRIVLCGLKTWARKVFAVPRLDSLWEIFDTRQEASEAILALGIDTANTQFEQAAQGQARTLESHEEMEMKPFRVWVRPLGETCRVRVQGLDNGIWLRDRLVDMAIVEISETVGREDSIGIYTFSLPYREDMPRSMLEDVLSGFPQIQLTCEPA